MVDDPLKIAIVVGEESGDQLGAALIDAIRSRRPDAAFMGVAGGRMIARGMRSAFPLGDVAVMGFTTVLRHLPRIVRRVYRTVDLILQAEPDVLVIVDSPEFTHPIAKRIARRRPDLPIIDYVSPSVWAWRSGRARKMAGYIDHVLALLPFEPEAHRRLGGPPCTYVGHPLIERLPELTAAAGERPGIGERPTLLVMPGSRQTEISRLMQPFGEVVAIVAEALPGIEIIVPAVDHLRAEIEERSASWRVRPKIISGEAEKFAAFRRAHAALAAAGTATLELGLAGVPMVAAYRTEWISKILKPYVVKVPSIVLTNLILGANVVPEFLNDEASPEALAGALLPLLAAGEPRDTQIAALAQLRERMLLPDGRRPSDAAADIVLAAAKAGPAFAAGRRR
jgi:lipid-A-disaccharide synthase